MTPITAATLLCAGWTRSEWMRAIDGRACVLAVRWQPPGGGDWVRFDEARAAQRKGRSNAI